MKMQSYLESFHDPEHGRKRVIENGWTDGFGELNVFAVVGVR